MKKIQKKAAKNKLDEGGAAEIERAMEEEKLNILASAHHHSNSSINIENASHQISIHFQRYRVSTVHLLVHRGCLPWYFSVPLSAHDSAWADGCFTILTSHFCQIPISPGMGRQQTWADNVNPTKVHEQMEHHLFEFHSRFQNKINF